MGIRDQQISTQQQPKVGEKPSPEKQQLEALGVCEVWLPPKEGDTRPKCSNRLEEE